MKNSLMILFLVLLSSQSSFAGEICHQELHNCPYYILTGSDKYRKDDKLIDNKGRILSNSAAQLDGGSTNGVDTVKINNNYYLSSYIHCPSEDQTYLPIKKDKDGLYVDRAVSFSKNTYNTEEALNKIWSASEWFFKKTKLSNFKWDDFLDDKYNFKSSNNIRAVKIPSNKNPFIIYAPTDDNKIRKYWRSATGGEDGAIELDAEHISCISNCPKPVNKSRFVAFSGSMNNSLTDENNTNIEMIIDTNDYSLNKFEYLDYNVGIDWVGLTKISTIKKGACYKVMQNKKENGYLCGIANDSIFSGSWYDLKWKKKYTFKLYREII